MPASGSLGMTLSYQICPDFDVNAQKMRTLPDSLACNSDQMTIVAKDLLVGTSEIGMILLQHV
jgi:hypothetical protein